MSKPIKVIYSEDGPAKLVVHDLKHKYHFFRELYDHEAALGEPIMIQRTRAQYLNWKKH